MADLSGLDAILVEAVASHASDIHLSAGAPPLQRIDSELVPMVGFPASLSDEWLVRSLAAIMSPVQQAAFAESCEVDLSYSVAGTGRFRVNVFRQMSRLAAAFRPIPTVIPSLEELGVPEVTHSLAMLPRGLVLVTGPTGSGKSTTLAAMVEAINSERSVHIITIEDPVEFVHRSKRSLIHQREVGSDTRSFGEALRRVLRQDPDVILIGEMRDAETMQVALTAAETGHLVLATLHTQGAAKSINRIVDSFPAFQQNQVRTQLGDTLQGVVSQTLVPRLSGTGRVVATEVLIHTPAVANLVREGQVSQLYSVLQTGSALGMHTLDQSLASLVKSGVVGRTVARELLEDPRGLDNVLVENSEGVEKSISRAQDQEGASWLL